MDELQTILTSYRNKKQKDATTIEEQHLEKATSSDIPDVFFDHILVKYKLTRVDIIVLMYLYRQVWCKPNLHRRYGLTPVLSYKVMTENFEVSVEEIHGSVHRLESYGFIEIIRSGQYFVRRFFIEALDKKFGQTYDDF